MLAIVAAILFLIALILELTGLGLGPIGATDLVTAGLLCLALDIAGVAPRSRLSLRR